jgi:hypothetical protein
MRSLLALSALALFGGTASAQVAVSAGVTVAAPTVHFEVAPPLLYVSPGVQVVEGYDEEVFFTGGWYWCRRDAVWFRTRDYHGGWVMAPRRYVPARIYRIPPGHYRNYHYAGPRGGGAVARPVHYARPVGGGYHEARGHAYGHAYAAPAGRPMMVSRGAPAHGGGHRR